MDQKYFVDERRNKIIEILNKKRRVKTKELAAYFSVTEDLIRKDFNFLEKKGLITKVYGGGILKTKMSEVTPFQEKMNDHNLQFAREASKLIEDGDTIFIESSSFTDPIFGCLDTFNNLTIVTNSFHATSLSNKTHKVIHTGGVIHPEDRGSYGRIATLCVEQFYFDKCFLSLTGLTPDWKVTAVIDDDVTLKQAALKHSKKSIMLISWDKFHRHGIYHVCSLEEIDTIVSDVDDQEVISNLKSKNINLVPVSL
ncbi:DeoR/GlpR family DNA-binding transcription regulator [Bacillus carboniphilus]|uniref:DeoR/GlpR family DNA-binding transcription regulator n=1 Tax=Bacillus carboniphilus TaxID=86663 RepID=A0ABN0WPC9_9BACI